MSVLSALLQAYNYSCFTLLKCGRCSDNMDKSNQLDSHRVYMQVKNAKLDNQFAEQSEKVSSIFQGVTVYVNGYTVPPASTLRRLLQQHGGQYQTHYSRSKVTHMVATRLANSKSKRLTDAKVVSADWITESIKTGKLLPWQRFQLCLPTSNTGRGCHEKLTVVPADIRHRLVTTLEEDDQVKSLVRASTDVCRTSTSHSISPELPRRLDAEPAAKRSNKRSTIPSASTAAEQERVSSAGETQLSTFYSKSRLHHLSSWTKELRELVRQLINSRPESPPLLSEWQQLVSQSGPEPLIHLVPRRDSGDCPRVQAIPPKNCPRIFFHIDMDCFFVSVSLLRRPDLVGKPVAITHANREAQKTGRCQVDDFSMSSVASCSYAARQMGVHNGMLLGEAKRLCPKLVTLPYDFEAYERVSKVLYRTVADFVVDIEAVSCDELYAECTDLLFVKTVVAESGEDTRYQFFDPLLFGSHLREKVRQLTGGCTASIGFGTSRLLARLATKRAKPDGQHFFLGCCPTDPTGEAIVGQASLETPKVGPRWRWSVASALDMPTVLDATGDGDVPLSCELTGSDGLWLCHLPLASLPGLGPALLRRLAEAFAVQTCGELMRHASHSQLCSLLGSRTGDRIYWLCRGRDVTTSLQTGRCAKSVSASMNYGIRLKTGAELRDLVSAISFELAARMKATITATDSQSKGVVGSSLTVRVFVRAPEAPVESRKYMGHGVCSTSSRMVSLATPTGDADTLLKHALPLVRRLCPDATQLRGLGLHMKKLLPVGKQPTLRTFDLDDLVGIPQQQRTPKCRKDDHSPQSDRDAALQVTKEPEQHGMNEGTRTEYKRLPEEASPAFPAATESTGNLSEECQVGDNPIDVFKDKSHDELIEILAEWITTEPSPQAEDLTIFSDYLLSIVPLNLERVRSILMSFTQLTRTLASDLAKWEQAISKLSSRVNEAVRTSYSGSILQL